jgi:AraC family transcriptional regulator, exoenzyme S synthesis regulatory protein ExsA
MLPYFTQKVPPAESLLELKFKELLFNVFSDPSNAALLAYINSIEDQQKTPVWQIMEANYAGSRYYDAGTSSMGRYDCCF